MLMDFLVVLAALTQRKDKNKDSVDDKYQLIKDTISEAKDYNKKMSVANGYLERIIDNIRKYDIIEKVQSQTKTYNDLKSMISDGINFIVEINDYRYVNSEIKRKCQSRLLNKFLKYNQLLHSMDKIIKDKYIPMNKKIDCIIKLSK